MAEPSRGDEEGQGVECMEEPTNDGFLHILFGAASAAFCNPFQVDLFPDSLSSHEVDDPLSQPV